MTEIISFGFMLIFIIIDILTGYIYSKISKTYKSSKMRLGFYHKFGEIGLVLLLYLVSYYTKLITPNVNLIEMFKLIECSSIYVIINEIGSVKENLTLIKEYNN
jgi:hypothetical protein|nr:MAG TPA: holin [Caudoviricetes sp.]